MVKPTTYKFTTATPAFLQYLTFFYSAQAIHGVASSYNAGVVKKIVRLDPEVVPFMN
jgi:hypothetical protein